MRKIRIALLITLFIGLGTIPLGIIGAVFAKTEFVTPNYEPVDWQSGLAGDVEMPVFDPEVDYSYYSAESGLAMATPPVGTMVYDWYVNAISGSPWMTLRAIGDFVEVWVQDDLSFPAGDPRNAEPWRWQITDDMAEYLADEFDNTIYATLAGYYGAPFDRDGTGTIFQALGWPSFRWDWIETTDPDNPQRVILKIINYRDDNYYDPTYPSYVAGFYSSDYTWYYYNRNMVHLDSWEWCERLGPEGLSWLPEHPEIVVDRPNLYESTLAHEFQHLIHSDRLPGDDTYMNEACSLYAEPLCGYELDAGQIEWFMATPDNSLTEWGDQGDINILADYGAAFLWALYLTDHYGTTFMGDYVKNMNPGMDGINALLAPYGVDYYDVFRDWTIANLLNGDGLYGYDSIDLDELDTDMRVYEISKSKFPWTSSEKFGKTYTHATTYAPDGYDTGIRELNPFGTDYIALTGITGENYILFDGDDLAKYPFEWDYEGDEGWHTKKGDLMNILLAGEAYVDPLDPTLSLNTYWEIEEYWDFGFVQVSTDDGETWTTLANDYTVPYYDYHALHKMVDILPGLTGHSGAPVEMEFDLNAYAGQNVLIGFRYMTDWGTFENGWYIYEASVSGASVDLEDVPKEADFMVTILKTDGVDYEVTELSLSDMDETGTFFDDIAGDEDIILIISAAMEYGTVDYKFTNKL
ncbi:MAG: immune inhibitor A [Candidatus Lokiarchaeota archaeon]|nr:immune inhibitor A [Candidatus Lokiarchaeota archaeon]